MFDSLFEKIRGRRERKQFHEFGFRVVTFTLPKDGEVQYSQWLHPDEFRNHAGNDGNVVTQESIDFFRQFVGEGDTVIDIGAHEGDTTMPMALAAGKSGLALAFEPNPHSFKVLKANSKLNSAKTNLIPVNFAATAFDGEFTFGSGDASFGNGGIVGFTHNKFRNVRYTFQVQGRNVEQYLASNFPDKAARISLIKIDAEGYDKEIVKTLAGIIRATYPVFITECFGPSTIEEKRELFDLFDQAGYELFRLPGFNLEPMTQLTRADMSGKKTFDILAKRP